MSVVPPELLDDIVREIDDLESLKACSLVVSTLRHTSQRILFNSLTIDIKNFTAIRDLLTESPHITHYVTSLRALLAGLDVESFGRILPKLQNVRKCFLDGVWHSSRRSSAPLRSEIPPIILDFLTRQPLHTVGLMSIYIPIAVLRNLVKIIPTLYFLAVSIEAGADAVPAHTVSQPPVERFALNSLFLIGNDVGQFLAHPHNISCVAALRHLSVRPSDNGWAGALIEGASSTLNHIEFNCSSLSIPFLCTLPVLTLTDHLSLRLSTPSAPASSCPAYRRVHFFGPYHPFRESRHYIPNDQRPLHSCCSTDEPDARQNCDHTGICQRRGVRSVALPPANHDVG